MDSKSSERCELSQSVSETTQGLPIHQNTELLVLAHNLHLRETQNENNIIVTESYELYLAVSNLPNTYCESLP